MEQYEEEEMETKPLVHRSSSTKMAMNYTTTQDCTSTSASAILNKDGRMTDDDHDQNPRQSYDYSNNGEEPPGGGAEYPTDDKAPLEQFHEDAILKIGFGKLHLLLFTICGLVMCTDLSELMALIMSSKSAQFEFCVNEGEREWLVGSTLFAMAFGSLFFSTLGDKLGRKKMLVYALGVGSIFSVASVTMPTEGTFLSARVCSGVCIGGCLPLTITYFCEFVQSKHRPLAISLLFLWWPLSAGCVVMISWFLLPSTGFHLNEELGEHFISWRKLLLAAWAPNLVPLIGLLFMPEGPLGLLINGKDGEAMAVYKMLHKWNKKGGGASSFSAGEMEIPSTLLGINGLSTPRNVLGDVKRALDSFHTSFLLLWTEGRRRLTLSLFLIWLLVALGHSSLSSWLISHVSSLRDITFDKDAQTVRYHNYNHTSMSQDLVNIRFVNCTFNSVTLENLLMNHVVFDNCEFHQTNFSNVKASYVLFKHSLLNSCSLVDTNLGRSDFQECQLIDVAYEGLNPECHLIPDFNMHISNDVYDSGLPMAGVGVGALLSVLLVLTGLHKLYLATLLLFLSSLICVALRIWKFDRIWLSVGHTIINALIASVWTLLVTVVERYPARIKSTTLGLWLCGARAGAFIGVGLYVAGFFGGGVSAVMSAVLLGAASMVAFYCGRNC